MTFSESLLTACKASPVPIFRERESGCFESEVSSDFQKIPAILHGIQAFLCGFQVGGAEKSEI